jgi:hypothetical protein
MNSGYIIGILIAAILNGVIIGVLINVINTLPIDDTAKIILNIGAFIISTTGAIVLLAKIFKPQ